MVSKEQLIDLLKENEVFLEGDFKEKQLLH